MLGELTGQKPAELDIPERVWETFACIKEVGLGLVNMSERAMHQMPIDTNADALFFLKANTAIMALLEESGRLSEYREWCGEHTIAQKGSEL